MTADRQPRTERAAPPPNGGPGLRPTAAAPSPGPNQTTRAKPPWSETRTPRRAGPANRSRQPGATRRSRATTTNPGGSSAGTGGTAHSRGRTSYTTTILAPARRTAIAPALSERPPPARHTPSTSELDHKRQSEISECVRTAYSQASLNGIPEVGQQLARSHKLLKQRDLRTLKAFQGVAIVSRQAL